MTNITHKSLDTLNYGTPLKLRRFMYNVYLINLQPSHTHPCSRITTVHSCNLVPLLKIEESDSLRLSRFPFLMPSMPIIPPVPNNSSCYGRHTFFIRTFTLMFLNYYTAMFTVPSRVPSPWEEGLQVTEVLRTRVLHHEPGVQSLCFQYRHIPSIDNISW